MKYLFTWTFLLLSITIILFSCKSKSVLQDDELTKQSQFDLLNLSKTNGVFHKDQINENLVLIFDTINAGNYCNWENTTTNDIKGYIIEENENLENILFLQPSQIIGGQEQQRRRLYQVEEKNYLLVMSCEEGLSIFTSWEKMEKDSFRFIDCFSPNINTKHASIRILEHLIFNNEVFLINKIEGAEAGSNSETLWVSKIKQDSIILIDEARIDYSYDDGDWAHLSYTVEDNVIEIIEHRNKMKLDGQTWLNKGSKNSKLKRIILE